MSRSFARGHKSSADETVALLALSSSMGGALPGLPATPSIMFLGDSNTSGSNGVYQGLVGGYPARAIQSLLGVRADFEVVGSQILVAEQSAGCSVFYSEGHPGFTIAQLTAGYAGYCASTGVGIPDIVVVMAGTNDIAAGQTVAQMQSDYAALFAQILATGSKTRIIWMPPPQFVDGTTTHASLATWVAKQQAIVAWMAGWAPKQANSYYLASSQLPGNGQYIVDGVHWGLSGQGLVGDDVARQFDIWLGPRRKLPIPRVFVTRQPWASQRCITDTTDGLTCTAHPGFDPGSGSFVIAFNQYMTAVPSAGTYNLISYGTYAVNNFYGIFAVSDGTTVHIRVYWANTAVTIGGPTTSSFAELPGLLINKWNRIVVEADASTGTVGLYVNGQCGGLAQGVAPWTNTQQTLYVALDATFGQGLVGYYQMIQAYKPTSMPRPGSVAALQAALADYYQSTSPIIGQGSANFPMDTTLADDVYSPGDPNPGMVQVGAMATTSAYPSGTPIAPWNWQDAGPAGPGV